MSSYDTVTPLGSFDLTTTPQKIVDADVGRNGYRVFVKTGTVLIREMVKDATAPSEADMVTDRQADGIAAADEVFESGNREGDIYAATTAGAGRCFVQLLVN